MASEREEDEGGKAGPETMASGSVSTGHDEKEEDGYSGGMDRINELPEGILLSILSLLTLKDAVKTSSLSRRWVDLWKSAVTVLDFDATKVPKLVVDKPNHLIARRAKFKEWVSGVVRQLKDASSTSKLIKFRVSFTMSDRYDSDRDIAAWLEFAISKRVESLELSLFNPFVPYKSCWQSYIFAKDCFNHIKTPAGGDIKSLRSLRLSYVALRDETIEHFISNCPYLEELAVYKSRSLWKLRIAAAAAATATGSSSSSSSSSSPPLALKRLEVMGCCFLRSLEVDNAPCLTHLAYQGHREMELRLKNCVSLVDVCIGFDRCASSLAFDTISCYAGQLAALTVKIDPKNIDFLNVVEFPRLELLTVESFGSYDERIVSLVPLINACPRLHRLRLTMSTRSPLGAHRGAFNIAGATSRESIKVVEIMEFTGYQFSCYFMEYILRCFTKLERIVLHIISSNPLDASILSCRSRQVEEARRRALDFKSKASPAIEFVII